MAGRSRRRRYIDLREALVWRRDRRTDREQVWLVGELARLQPTLQWIPPSASYVGFATLDGDSLGQLRPTYYENPSVRYEWESFVDRRAGPSRRDETWRAGGGLAVPMTDQVHELLDRLMLGADPWERQNMIDALDADAHNGVSYRSRADLNPWIVKLLARRGI